MPNPKISFIMITARSDYPYQDRADLHLFGPTLESFKRQTMKDFEWVIVDALYEQRKDYFEDVKVDFPIRHVPAQPNVWLEKGFPGICRQYNKGIIHSDGDILFFTGDSHIVTPDFMEQLWRHYLHGYFPLAWYVRDYTFRDPASLFRVNNAGERTIVKDGKLVHEKTNTVVAKERESPIPYNILGYSGKNVFVEFRYDVFENSFAEMKKAPWEWWFGCSSASLEAMLEINGFNETFDGDQSLLDCDVGSRLEMAGYGNSLYLFRDFFLIRIPTDTSFWNKNLAKANRVTIKCNYPLIWHSRLSKTYKANSRVLTDEDIEWMKTAWCGKHCRIRDVCQKEHPWQYPFEHKEGYPGHNSSKEWFNFWKNNQEVVDLREERIKRIDGTAYTEGTFI